MVSKGSESLIESYSIYPAMTKKKEYYEVRGKVGRRDLKLLMLFYIIENYKCFNMLLVCLVISTCM